MRGHIFSNNSLIEKADLETSDLQTSGGYLQDEQVKEFMLGVTAKANFFKLMDVRGSNSHTVELSYLDMDDDVLVPIEEYEGVSREDRVKPNTDRKKIQTFEMGTEIRLSRKSLEDNIKSNSLRPTVIGMLKEKVRLGLEKYSMQADSVSGTGVLGFDDGLLKDATSHVVDAGGNPISHTYLDRALAALPDKYEDFVDSYMFFTNPRAAKFYRRGLSERTGDKAFDWLLGKKPVFHDGHPIIPIGTIPRNTGTGSGSAQTLFCNPKNAAGRFWRKLLVEHEYSARTRTFITCMTMRYGVGWKQEDRVVKIFDHNVPTAA